MMPLMTKTRRFLMAMMFTGAALCAYSDMLMPTDESEERLDRARQFYAERKDQEALEAFKSVLELQEDQYDALWHALMLHLAIGHRDENDSTAEVHLERAQTYAQRLLETHPERAGSHFAYAATVGRRAERAGARERARLSVIIRRHAEKAIELDPLYAGAWNVLGVWHHRAANVSRVERMAANLLFGKEILEGASNGEARKAFTKAIEIDPSFILFYLDKAEFLMTVGDIAAARETLEEGLALEVQTSDDPRWKQKMREMLSKL